KASSQPAKATLIGGKGNLSLGFDEHSKGAVVDGRDFHHGAEAAFFDVHIPRAELFNYFVDTWFGSRTWCSIRPRRATSFGGAAIEGELANHQHWSASRFHRGFTIKDA